MPRGVKRTVNYEQDIAELEGKLSALKTREAKISQQLKELTDKKRLFELNELNSIIKKSDLSLDEIKKTLLFNNTGGNKNRPSANQ